MQEFFNLPVIQLKTTLPQGLKTEWALTLGKYGAESPPQWGIPSYGTVMKHQNILTVPELEETAKLFGGLCAEGLQMLGKDYTHYSLMESWLNKYDRGMGQEIHTHTGSSYSAVLYLQVPDKCPPFMIYHPYRTQMIAPTPDWSPFYSLDLYEGYFIMFPSFVEHSVPIHSEEGVKISLAGNMYFNPPQ